MICCFCFIKNAYLDLLFDGDSVLDLFLELELNLFSLCFVLFLVLIEVFDVLFKDLIAFFERAVSVLGLIFEVGDLFFDDFVSHGDEEHFLFLFEYVNDGLIFAFEVFVFFAHLDDFECVLNEFFVFGVEGVLWDKIGILRNNVLVKSFQGSATRGGFFVPDFFI